MAIFFDFDGTLVDVTDRFYGVYVTVCQMFGANTLSKCDYWQARQRRMSIREILSLTNSNVIYDDFIAEHSRLIEATQFLCLDTLREGARGILEHLARRTTVHLVSLRDSRENLLWQLHKLEIWNYFASINTASAFGTFEDKTRLLLVTHAESGQDLIVGDSENDIRAGKALGLFTCGLLNGMRSETELRNLKPDYLISSLSELRAIVDQLPVVGLEEDRER